MDKPSPRFFKINRDDSHINGKTTCSNLVRDHHGYFMKMFVSKHVLLSKLLYFIWLSND